MRTMQIAFAATFLIFFFLTGSMVGKSDLVALLLYSLPLFLQFFKKGLVRIYGLWFGIFLVLQTLASLFVLQSDYHTMKPGMHKISDGKTIGIEGKQLLITDEHGYRTTKKVDYGKSRLRTFEYLP